MKKALLSQVFIFLQFAIVCLMNKSLISVDAAETSVSNGATLVGYDKAFSAALFVLIVALSIVILGIFIYHRRVNLIQTGATAVADEMSKPIFDAETIEEVTEEPVEEVAEETVEEVVEEPVEEVAEEIVEEVVEEPVEEVAEETVEEVAEETVEEVAEETVEEVAEETVEEVVEEPVEEVAEETVEEVAEETIEEVAEETVEEVAEETVEEEVEETKKVIFSEVNPEESTLESNDMGDLIRESISVDEAKENIEDDVLEQLVVKGHDLAKYRKAKKEKHIINIDTISEKFENGDVVNLESLKVKGLLPKKCNYFKVLARGILDKKLTVEANDFSKDAIKMILLTGGNVVRIQ